MEIGSNNTRQEQYLEILFPSIIGEDGGPGGEAQLPGDPHDDDDPENPEEIDHWSLEQGRLEGVFVDAAGVTYFLERVTFEDPSKLYFSLENFDATLSEIDKVYTFERTDIILEPTSSVSDRSSAVVSEFGSIAWLADWYDLKSVADFIDVRTISDVLDLREKDNPNIPINAGDEFGNEGPFVLFDGTTRFSGDRAYFVADHEGTVAWNWLVHDTINNNQIDLGSWIYSRDVLAGIDLTANHRIVGTPSFNNPAFNIFLASTSGNLATFEIYATAAADSGDPGLEDLQFVLSHNTADMTIDGASISTATGITAVPNLNQAAGTLTLAGFALPPFTDLNTPVLTFEATILNEETPLTITIDDIFADDTAHPRIEEQFDFSSLEISTTVSDRFGNALPDAVVSAYEVQIGDDLFLREVSSSDTSSVFAIVAKPKEAVSSIDFDLLDNAGLIDFQVGSALSGWSIQSNTNTPDTVRFAGFGAINGSQDLAAGQETVLATFTTSIDPDFVIDGIFLNTTAQADISVGEIAAVSKMGNVTVHQVARGSDVYLDANKPIDDASDRAITANDALQALRLAVGLTKSNGTAQWHDYIAADINRDGQVTANDALNILKFVVGLTDGPSADWVFLDGDADWSAIGRRNTNYEEGVWLENIVADTSVNMTGILVGDVNGSYLGTGWAVPAPVPFSVSINGDQISFANLVDGVIRFVEPTEIWGAVFGTGVDSVQQTYVFDGLNYGISDKTLVVAAGQTLEISIAELQNVYVEGVRVTGAGNVVITATDPQIADDNQILVNVDLHGGNLTFDLPSDDNDVIVLKTGSIIDLAGGTLIVDDGTVDARLADIIAGGIVVNSKLVITHDQFIALGSEFFISGNGTVEVVVACIPQVTR